MKPLTASAVLGLPWALTPRQVEILTLWAELGTQKAVARHLGVAKNTISGTVEAARKRMGATTTTHALLAFDRAMRKETK